MVRLVCRLISFWEVPQGSVLEMLFILYASEFFHIVENYMVAYANDTKIYAVIPRPLSRPQGMESLTRNLGAIHSLCLKWHMRLNPKKTKSMVAMRSRIHALGYGDLTLGGAKLEEVKPQRILEVTFLL